MKKRVLKYSMLALLLCGFKFAQIEDSLKLSASQQVAFADDFESGESSWGSNGMAVHEVVTDAYSGEKALKSTLKDGESQNRIQRYYEMGADKAFKENVEYEVSFYAKSTSASGIEGYLYFYDDQDRTITAKISAPTDNGPKTNSEWKKYSFKFSVGVENGVVKGQRTWVNEAQAGYYSFSGSASDTVNIVGFNLVLFENVSEWYMDEWRIISTSAPYVAPETKAYVFDRFVEDFNDSNYDKWSYSETAEIELKGDEDKYLEVSKGTSSYCRFQTKLYFDELKYNESLPLQFDFDAKGEGEVNVYIQYVGTNDYAKTIKLVAGNELTDSFTKIHSDIFYTIDSGSISYVWHRPDYAGNINATEDIPAGTQMQYIDLIIEATEKIDLNNIRLFQETEIEMPVASVVDAIEAIGDVNASNCQEVLSLKESYDALSEQQQAQVFNYYKLQEKLVMVRLIELAPNHNVEEISIDYSAKDYTGQEIVPTSELVSVRIYDANGDELKPLLPGTYKVASAKLYLEDQYACTITYQNQVDFVINKIANEVQVPVSAFMYDPNNETYMLANKYEVSLFEDFHELFANSGSLQGLENKSIYVREKETDIANPSQATMVTLTTYSITLPEQVGFEIIPQNNKTALFAGGYYKFSINVATDYEGQPIVKVNGEVVEEDDGLYSVSVMENVSITVEGLTRKQEQPSEEPSVEPSVEPSEEPSEQSSATPSVTPSVIPSVEPVSEQASQPAEETSKQEGGKKKGCKGEAATSLFGLIALVGAFLFKKRNK